MNLCAYKIYNKNRSSKFKEEWKREEKTRNEGFFIGEPWAGAENVIDYRWANLCNVALLTVFFAT